MSTFPLRLPDELQEAAEAQAAASGLTLNEYIIAALAVRVGAQAEAERAFQARAKRSSSGRAREILGRAGKDNPPQPGDELQ
jgi:hypothetical protein